MGLCSSFDSRGPTQQKTPETRGFLRTTADWQRLFVAPLLEQKSSLADEFLGSREKTGYAYVVRGIIFGGGIMMLEGP
jgi:hypothetical protein